MERMVLSTSSLSTKALGREFSEELGRPATAEMAFGEGVAIPVSVG